MIPLDESWWIIWEFSPEADIAIEEHQLWQMSCSCWDGFQTRSCCYYAEATLWSPTALKFFLPSPGEAAILQQSDNAILTFQASAQTTTKETTRNLHGCFLKWWYPQNTPKWSFLVGKPMVVGETHHFRKPPHESMTTICLSVKFTSWGFGGVSTS